MTLPDLLLAFSLGALANFFVVFCAFIVPRLDLRGAWIRWRARLDSMESEDRQVMQWTGQVLYVWALVVAWAL